MGATFSKLWHCASRATQLAILPLWFGACLIAAIAIPLFICTAGSPVAVLYCFVKWLLTRTQDEARIYSRYEYGPSESRLLELPPETRGEIWQHLLGDHDTVYVELKDELLTMTLCEKISVIGAPRGFLGPLPDFKFQRTSRQVYAEVDHMFYTTRTFCFTDQPTFTAFVEGLNIVQKRNVKNVYICVNSIFFKTQFAEQSHQRDGHNDAEYSGLTRSSDFRALDRCSQGCRRKIPSARRLSNLEERPGLAVDNREAVRSIVPWLSGYSLEVCGVVTRQSETVRKYCMERTPPPRESQTRRRPG